MLVNGKALSELWLPEGVTTSNFGPYTDGQNCYFMLVDTGQLRRLAGLRLRSGTLIDGVATSNHLPSESSRGIDGALEGVARRLRLRSNRSCG